MALFIHKENNFFVHGVNEIENSENKKTELIRDALRTYVRKNAMENTIANEKTTNILNSLLDE